MRIGMVGLGRMGSNLVRRLLADGHQCVVTDLDEAPVRELAEEGAEPAAGLRELVEACGEPGRRVVWVMVPAGDATGGVLARLGDLLEEGDVVVDGGNSFFRDTLERAGELGRRGIRLVDCGTSGGVWGLERGYCLMVGADEDTFARLEPLFVSLAPGVDAADRTPHLRGARRQAEHGYLRCGPVGSGHFVKMVHNGIEYAVMQSYAEGFDLLRAASAADTPEEERFPIPVGDVAEVWRRGSVIGSWLLDLTANALAADPELDAFEGRVGDSGEGRWTVQTAIDRAVPVPATSAALYARFRSRVAATFGDRLLSAMRHEFGGHVEKDPPGR